MADVKFPSETNTKATPVQADILLIADSEDSNAIKDVTIGEVLVDALIDDSSTATTKLWSADKITTQLATKQALDSGLTSIAGLTTAADKMIYTTASDTYATTDLSSFGRTLIDDAAATNARTTLWLVIGTDVQAYDATLTALSSSLTAANKIPYATATDTLGELDFKDEDTMSSNSDTAVPSQQSVKAYIDNNLSTLKYKAADQTKNSDTTLANDNDLTFTVVSSWLYLIDWILKMQSWNTAFKLAFSGTSTTTWFVHALSMIASTSYKEYHYTNIDSTPWTITGIANDDDVHHVKGFIDVWWTGGTFALQWAQNASHADSTTMNKWSWLQIRKLN